MRITRRKSLYALASAMVVSLAMTGLSSQTAWAQIGTANAIHHFTGSDGSTPRTTLLQGSDGYLYGTTRYGGTYNKGTVFKMAVNGTTTVLHEFTGGSDGQEPYGSLARDSSGNLYGTTTGGGGTYGQGVVYKISSAGTFTTLRAFTADPSNPVDDGKRPYGGLILGSDGDLYGTTLNALHMRPSLPDLNLGNVYKISTTGSYTNLHDFTAPSSGMYPIAGLFQASNGNFYGTTSGDSSVGAEVGTIFEINSTGTFSTIHNFTSSNLSEGGFLSGPLVQGTDGDLYGMAPYYGSNNCGTAYKITTGGTFSVIHQFTGSTNDGETPRAGFVVGSDGNLYGTSAKGAFQMTYGGTLSKIVNFDYGNETGLIQGKDGYFYGVADGGSNGYGYAYQLSVPSLGPSALSSTGTVRVLTPFTITATMPYAPVRTITIPVSGSDGSSGTITVSQGSTTGTGSVSSVQNFPGDITYTANYSGGTASFVKHVTCGTTTAVTSSLNPATAGNSITFTATVTSTGSGVPEGSVRFYDGATIIKTVVLTADTASSAKATFTTTTLSVGTHNIAVLYTPSSTDWGGSGSTAIAQVVN